MAKKPSKNAFSLMKDNSGNPKFDMSGNSQMTNHVGDNYLSFNLPTSDDHLPASPLGALNETSNVFSSSSKNETSAEKLCDVVNKNTIQMTRISVIEDFSKKKLNEPDFEVHPQMRRVKDYFEGGLEDWEESEIVITKKRFLRRTETKVLRNQTRREMGFHFQKKRDDEETLTFPDLLESFTQDKKLGPHKVNPATGIVASAGTGKTTVLKRLAGKCAADSVASKSMRTGSIEADGKTRFQMVRYMEMKNMQDKLDTDVSSFLFDGLYKNKEDEKKAYEWLLEHQSEAILYFDGLDQATWDIPNRNQRKITSFQRANTPEIMYNLLSGNLLPHVKIVITSRQFKFSKLPAEARPDEIVTLIGFQRHDAEKLFICLVGERGAEFWENFQTMARRLLNLISIPVFLVLTAALLAMDPDKPPPVTVTELFNRIIMNLSQVENVQERERIHDVISKLKDMAHQGMVEGRVVFYESDLKTFGLLIEDVRDLMIKVPGNNVLSRYLVEGDYIFFFCHQSLQEFLSASFIAEMKDGDFSRFNELHLHESRWSIVRAFVSGIIHDKSTPTLLKFYEKKRRTFRRNFRYGKEGNQHESLAAIYESNDDEFIRSLQCLPSVIGARLGPDEVHMFSSLLARRRNRKELSIRLSRFNNELLDIMVQDLKERKIQVARLRLNWFTQEGLNRLLAVIEADEIVLEEKLVKDFRFDDLDWSNIRVITWPYNDDQVKMINGTETVTIEGNSVKGCFEKTRRALNTDRWLFLSCCPNLSLALDLLTFLQIKFFKIDDQLYVRLKGLSRLKNFPLEVKIPKILLDCRGRVIDSSLIEFCVTKCQVSCLDIVVDEETSFVPSNFLTETESHFNLKVHWCFKINCPVDVAKLIAIVQQNQVENLRLQISETVSFDDIKRVIENCRVKTLDIVYWEAANKILTVSRALKVIALDQELLPTQRGKIVNLASEHSIEAEFTPHCHMKGSAWWFADDPPMLMTDATRDVLKAIEATGMETAFRVMGGVAVLGIAGLRAVHSSIAR